MVATYCFLVLFVFVAMGQTTPVGPVIGIMTQTGGPQNTTYIAASYVKFLEAAGARVIPIPFDAPLAVLTELFGYLNGLFIPGGGMDLSDYDDPFLVATRHLYNLAIASNDNGNYFPIWGTCLGFETISILTANTSDVLSSGFDSENLPLALTMTPAAPISRLYGSAPDAVYKTLSSEACTMNNHQSGVTPASFAANQRLKAFYNILSTNVDREGREFISSIEGIKYPVYAVQWHPEKNMFEWTPNENIPHSSTSVTACTYIAKFFVDEARKSTTVMPYTTLMSLVIWNYSPFFTGANGSDFTQEYSFPIYSSRADYRLIVHSSTI